MCGSFNTVDHGIFIFNFSIWTRVHKTSTQQEICGEELEYFVHFILDNSHSHQAFKSRAPRKCPLRCGCWGVISQDGSFYCTNVTSITFRWDKRKRERVFENQFSQTPYVRTLTGLELHWHHWHQYPQFLFKKKCGKAILWHSFVFQSSIILALADGENDCHKKIWL